jgi:hypothetical protein
MRALAILASCPFCSQYPGAAQDSRMPRSSRLVQIPVPEFRGSRVARADPRRRLQLPG